MLNLALFWLVVISFVVGQALLIRSAWRLRQGAPEAPAGAPASNGAADLGWTLLTAVATAALLAAVYRALI